MFLLFPGTYFCGLCNHLWWKCCVKSRLNLSHSQRLSLSIPIKIALIKKNNNHVVHDGKAFFSFPFPASPELFFPLWTTTILYYTILCTKRRHPIRNSDFFMFAFVHDWVKLSTGKIIIQWIFTDINIYSIGEEPTGSRCLHDDFGDIIPLWFYILSQFC